MGAIADILIAGAGPAGTAVAVAAARRGCAVTLLDRARFPRDKPCGEGLLPSAVAALARLGVLAQVRARAHRLDGIRFAMVGGPLAQGDFLDAQGAPAHGLGIARRTLDALLVEAARAQPGVTLLEGVEALGLLRRRDGIGGLLTSAGPIGARAVVAADGLGSRLRAQLGLDAPAVGRARLGLRMHFAVGGELPRRVRVLLAPEVEYYLTPVAPRCLQVAVLGERDAFARLGLSAGTLATHLRERSPLAGELAAATPVDRALGAGPLRRRVRALVTDGALLVGDAAGYVDAITGEGVGLALATGLAAADTLADALAGARTGRDALLPASALRGYARAHRALVRDADRLTRLVLFCAARPWLARRAIAALDRRPALFARLLAVQAGASLSTVPMVDWARLVAG